MCIGPKQSTEMAMKKLIFAAVLVAVSIQAQAELTFRSSDEFILFDDTKIGTTVEGTAFYIKRGSVSAYKDREGTIRNDAGYATEIIKFPDGEIYEKDVFFECGMGGGVITNPGGNKDVFDYKGDRIVDDFGYTFCDWVSHVRPN